jgi:hypothetical protein
MSQKRSKKKTEALKNEVAAIVEEVKVKKPGRKKSQAVPEQAAQITKPEEAYIIIDYPTANEAIVGFHYAIRIGASSDGAVEISIDSADWLPCRNAAGYWWFDWENFSPGTHTITARIVNQSVRSLKETQKIKVKAI